MKEYLILEVVPKLQFWNNNPGFTGKSRLQAAFSRSLWKNHGVLEQAHLTKKITGL
jgi:hypothetical protein